MKGIDRITVNSKVMGGKPCIRGMRVTVDTILGLLAAGHSEDRILQAYPYLEKEDIRQVRAGNYTEERRDVYSEMELDELVSEIRQKKE
jgi:uncharacterized protein (DUF433 family)